MIAKHVVEGCLVVALALLEALEHKHAGKTELAAGKGAGTGGRNGNAPRRNNTAAEFFASFGIDDRNRGGENATGAEHRSIANTGAFGNDAAATD